MPGPNSRFTGSATRRNSFAPSFITHGIVVPFGVVTGVYGPFGGLGDGSTGGCASAACVRSRPKPPARRVAPERMRRRVIMEKFLLSAEEAPHVQVRRA